jgi:hypothetical protein
VSERTVYRLHVFDNDDLDGYEFLTKEHTERWMAQPLIAAAVTDRSKTEPAYSVREVAQVMSTRRCTCCDGFHWVDRRGGGIRQHGEEAMTLILTGGVVIVASLRASMGAWT